MKRLNETAFDILNDEIKRNLKDNLLNQAPYKMLRRYLDRLCLEDGDRIKFTELLKGVRAIVPSFSVAVVRRAAAANAAGANLGSWLKWGTIVTLGSVGLLAIVNLPYPMIRTPVASTVPILLLPSFISMDRNYRVAIANVEQADQLINQATSEADIARGAEHVTEAQQALDRLPVWFLGYQPGTYCTLFRCTWRFTFDEFEQARKQIARMEARVFQEQNALSEYAAARADLDAAGQAYTTATTNVAKNQAIVTQQAAVDRLTAIPEATLAGRLARQQASNADRDLAATTNTVASDALTSNLVDAAKAFGWQAANLSQNPPHSATHWQEVLNLWEEAAAQLRSVQPTDPGYAAVQQKLAEYQTNISNTRIQLAAEQEAVEAFDRANDGVAQWQAIAADDPTDRRLVSLLQKIVNELNTIKEGTTPYEEAQTLRQQAQDALQRVSKAAKN